MTIETTSNKSAVNLTNGIADTFSFLFSLQQSSHLKVYRTDITTRIATLLVENSDYTVDFIAAEQDNDPGGTITTTTVYATGSEILLLRRVPLVQSTDLNNDAGWFPEVHERTYDYQMMAIQQLEEEIGRSIKLPVTELETDELTFLPSLADRAGKIAAWGPGGNFIPSAGVGIASTILAENIAQTVDTIALLKAVTAPVTSVVFYVRQYSVAGDQGGGFFRFDPASVATDDTGLVIAPNAGAGRWLRINYGVATVRHFGAKGDSVDSSVSPFSAPNGTDDTVAMQKAFDTVLRVHIPAGNYRTTAKLTYRTYANISGDGTWNTKICNYTTDGIGRQGTSEIYYAQLSDFGIVAEFNTINTQTGFDLTSNVQGTFTRLLSWAHRTGFNLVRGGASGNQACWYNTFYSPHCYHNKISVDIGYGVVSYSTSQNNDFFNLVVENSSGAWPVTGVYGVQLAGYGHNFFGGRFSMTAGVGLTGYGCACVRFAPDPTTGAEAVKTITNITNASPASVSVIAHGYSTGNTVFIRSVVGMTQVNNKLYTITVTGANTFTLDGIDSTAYTPYTSGGAAVRPKASVTGNCTFSGMYYEGSPEYAFDNSNGTSQRKNFVYTTHVDSVSMIVRAVATDADLLVQDQHGFTGATLNQAGAQETGTAFNALVATQNEPFIDLASTAAAGKRWRLVSGGGGLASTAEIALVRDPTGSAIYAWRADTNGTTVNKLKTNVIATASLPVAGSTNDGKIIIEDAGAGNRNLIIYAGGERFRIDGGANV